MNKEDIYYQAMLTRDNRFDGKFYVGVKTTGIYCRPICPAKPKRENVEFFSSSLAAEKVGYRPCLRCRPESAPGSPVWIGKSAMVKRAIKMIQFQETLKFDEDQFAALFGVSARHLRRVFTDEIGKTPKQLAFDNRLNLSRKLITETRLPLTEIAFSSGFESIRRFNDAFKKRFKKSPSEIRRQNLKKNSALTLTLAYRPPYDFKGLLSFYKAHQIGLLERFENDKMIRIVEFDGKVGEVIISNDESTHSLKVEIDFPDNSYILSILSRVRAMFDLDSDPVIIANALESDPAIKKIFKKHPGLRLPSGWDGFETGVCAILGQFVSVEFGRSLVNDLIHSLGEDSGRKYEGEQIKLFPSPEVIAKSNLSDLRTTKARKETLKAFCKSLLNGKLSLELTQDNEEFIQNLEKIKGIGPWTSNYMALKVLRHTDAFPATNLIIARALKKHSIDRINKMAPWRGYVTTLLWKEYAKRIIK